jgi:hypothetical protein
MSISKNFYVPYLLLSIFLNVFNKVQAQSTISFGETQITNQFPSGVSFQIQVTNPDLTIQSAEFIYYVPIVLRPNAIYHEKVSFNNAKFITLQYSWLGEGFPPGIQINYYWIITENNGQIYKSKEEHYQFNDIAYRWNHFEQDKFSLYCHDRKKEFCQKIFKVGFRAISLQKVFYNSDYQFPLTIWIYNNLAEIKRWQKVLPDYELGFSYTDKGIIAAYIPIEDTEENWELIQNIIPHEVSHLFLHWVTANGYIDLPGWLNEGSAAYNELMGKDRYVPIFNQMVANNTIIPINKLDLTFGDGDQYAKEQAYSESFNIVSYIIEVYGKDGYLRMLRAYNNSKTGDEAFYDAFQCTQKEFEANWHKWLDNLTVNNPPPKNSPGIVVSMPTLGECLGVGLFFIGVVIVIAFIHRRR